MLFRSLVVFVTPADARTPALLVAVFAALVAARTDVAVAQPACFSETKLVPLGFAVALSLCILLILVSSCCFLTHSVRAFTFREQACGSSIQMSSQIPSIAKVIIALNELNFVASSKTQFVGASGCEIICNGGYQSSLFCSRPSLSSASLWSGAFFV